MASPQHQPPLDGDTVDLLRRRARRFCRRLRLNQHDRQDVEQELTWALARACVGHDPGCLPWPSYAHVVIDRALAAYLRNRFARKRRPGPTPLHRGTTHSPTGSSEGAAADDGRIAQADLRLDVQALIAEQPEESQAALRLVAEHGVAEAARLLGIPDTTLRSRLRALRGRAEDLGLRDYLGNRS